MSREEMTVKLVDGLLSLPEELFQEFLEECRKTDKIQSRAVFESALEKIQELRAVKQLKTA